MRKGVKIIVWTLGSVIVLLIATVLFGPGIYGRMMAPDHEFGSKPLPAAPDYTLRAHWSGWPDDANPAERRPEGTATVAQEDRLADAFFLHPTTYGGTEHWVQPMDDQDAIRGTDLGTISGQASAFNGCCRVYAPRFRQSNIMGYQQEEVAKAIFDIGFEDVRAAFRHFIAEIDPDSPIVLGSHSQGTFHLVRLVMEEIDGTPLMDRLVAVYAIGHSLPSALVEEGYEDIVVCSTPTETGCFISWDAHEGDKKPSYWSNEDEQTLWNGTDYTGFAPSQNICVNPITWTTDSSPSDKAQHLGALPRWSREWSSDTIEDPLRGLMAGTVSTYCEQGEKSNWLFVNSDRDPMLKAQGVWSIFSRNLHGSDYSLFWANIRQNAEDRTRAFIDAREAKIDGKSEK